MSSPAKRLSRGSSIALAVSAVYSAALVVAAFTVPAYQGAGKATATLVGENGLSAAVVVAVPLAVTAAVAAVLAARWRGAKAAAWTLAGLLGVFNVLALLTIGVFVLPVTVSLVVACAIPRPPFQARSAAS